VQHLDGDLALEPQVACPEHPPEAARAEFLEQLVVVAQRAAQAALEPRLGHLGARGRLVKTPASLTKSSSISVAVK